MHQPVCAIVVTYHPTSDALDHLGLVRDQVDRVIVVDNGSPAATMSLLRKVAEGQGYLLIENGANLGLTTALNVGIRQAADEGHEWVLLLDQDSVMTPRFMDGMFDGIGGESERRKTAIYCPRYIDRMSGEEMRASRSQTGQLLVARTSGSLMPLWIFQECGWFVEELIIDQIDYEYCLRLRSRGFQIKQCPEATLVHSLGSPAVYRLLGFRLFGTTNHSAARRYYLARNRTWLLKKYWADYPRWCSGLCLITLKESLKIMIFEDRRWLKLGQTMLGLRDGVFGRMGMKVKL